MCASDEERRAYTHKHTHTHTHTHTHFLLLHLSHAPCGARTHTFSLFFLQRGLFLPPSIPSSVYLSLSLSFSLSLSGLLDRNRSYSPAICLRPAGVWSGLRRRGSRGGQNCSAPFSLFPSPSHPLSSYAIALLLSYLEEDLGN